MEIEQIDKRQRVINLISTSLEKERLPYLRKGRSFVMSSWYEKLLQEGQYDVVLECFVKSLGLSFKLYLDDLHLWRTQTGDNNQPIKEIQDWKRRIIILTNPKV